MECDYCFCYDEVEGYCKALNCTPLNCFEPLPCECGETDPVTLYVKGVKNEENTDSSIADVDV